MGGSRDVDCVIWGVEMYVRCRNVGCDMSVVEMAVVKMPVVAMPVVRSAIPALPAADNALLQSTE